MTQTTDPRATITPDSFGVAPELLGLPLARPARRAAAMAIDLLAVALLAQAGAVFFALLAAAALWRASAGTPRGAGARALRAFLRAAAAVILFVFVLNVFGSIGSVFDGDDDADDAPVAADARISLCEDASDRFGFRDLAQVPLLVALDDAEDVAGARTAAAGVTQWLRARGLDDAELRASLTCLRDDVDSEAGRSALDAELAGLAAAAGVGPTDGVAAPTSDTAATVVDSVAAAHLAALQARYDDAVEENHALRAENERMGAEIERYGFLDRVRSVADDLGLGFGWMALYFTALLVLMRGQTIGKRIVGVRVIRLDGRPLTWWMSFERFGGYAASVSTGLLGFLQILWDRNRQGLHDKAIETVVVRERARAAPPAAR